MRISSGIRLRLLLGGALAAVMASAAHAAPATPAAEPAPAADAPAVEGMQGLDEIVVTATKRETNLQKTPVSISVVDSQQIKDRHVQSLYDLADGSVPSLSLIHI